MNDRNVYFNLLIFGGILLLVLGAFIALSVNGDWLSNISNTIVGSKIPASENGSTLTSVEQDKIGSSFYYIYHILIACLSTFGLIAFAIVWKHSSELSLRSAYMYDELQKEKLEERQVSKIDMGMLWFSMALLVWLFSSILNVLMGPQENLITDPIGEVLSALNSGCLLSAMSTFDVDRKQRWLNKVVAVLSKNVAMIWVGVFGISLLSILLFINAQTNFALFPISDQWGDPNRVFEYPDFVLTLLTVAMLIVSMWILFWARGLKWMAMLVVITGGLILWTHFQELLGTLILLDFVLMVLWKAFLIILLFALAYSWLGFQQTKRVEAEKDVFESRMKELELKEEELKLELANQKRETVRRREIFAEIAHQFNNKLVPVRGPIERAVNNRAYQNLDELRTKLPGMLVTLNTLSTHSKEFLELSKLQKHEVKLDPKEGDFVTLLETILKEESVHAREKNITLSFNANRDQLDGVLDERAIRRITTNLIGNAIKFSPKNSTVKLTLKGRPRAKYTEGEKIEISIEDRGKGIPEDKLEGIFKIYAQGNESDKKQGFGLGLAIVENYVNLYNGKISVKSREGYGTTFTVQLPRHLEVQEQIAVENEDELGSSGDGYGDGDSFHALDPNARLVLNGTEGILDQTNRNIHTITYPSNNKEESTMKNSASTFVDTPVLQDPFSIDYSSDDEWLFSNKILIVEDETPVREEIKETLRGFTLLEASNAVDGLRLAYAEMPDLIVTDVMMETKDAGYELCRTLKGDDQTSHIPIIILSARTEKADIDTGYYSGAVAYVRKPNIEDVRGQVTALLTRELQLRRKYSELFSIDGVEKSVSSQKELVMNLWKAVRENIDNRSFKVSDLADAVNMSERTLQRSLEKIGLRPYDFIVTAKMYFAQKLLESKKVETLKSLAAAVGMNEETLRKKYEGLFGQDPASLLETLNKPLSDNDVIGLIMKDLEDEFSDGNNGMDSSDESKDHSENSKDENGEGEEGPTKS